MEVDNKNNIENIADKKETKKCSQCGEEKDVATFSKNPKLKSGYASKCKKCSNEYFKIYKRNTKNSKNASLRKYLVFKLENIKKQDNRKFPNHEFTLTVDDLVDICNKFEMTCVYSNKKLKAGCKVNIYSKISFDRVDNDLPHTKDNLQLTSQYMNYLRGNMTHIDFYNLLNN